MSSNQGVSQAREPRPFQSSHEKSAMYCPVVPEVAAGEFSVQIATTAEAIEALRPMWKLWAQTLDTDIDYFLHNLTHDSGSPRPYVITVYSDGIAQGMLVGQIRQRRAFSMVSFVNIPGPRARVLEIKKGGRMGRASPAIDKVLMAELLRATKSGEVDSVCFERLPLHSELFRQIRQSAGFLVRERVPHVFCYSVLSLTAAERKRPRVFSGK